MNKINCFNDQFYYIVYIVSFLNTKLSLNLQIDMKYTLGQNASSSKYYFPTAYIEFLYSHYNTHTNILRFLTH